MIDVVVLTVNTGNVLPLMASIDAEYDMILLDNTEHRDRNYSRSLNLALEHHTPGRRVLFISDDARPRPGSIAAMLGHDEPIVSTVNISSDGTLNHKGGVFVDGKWPMHFDRGGDLPPTCAYVEWVTWACTLVRDDVLQAVGEFDENYQWSHEEVDYQLRAREAGFGDPLVCADAMIDHDEHGVSDTPRQLRHNVAYFNEKWITSGRLERLWQPQVI